MKIGISVKIDVTKIDKARLFKGEKGTYLDLTTFIDTENVDNYGNHGFISQSQTKEERESGAERPPILGNVKVFYKGGTDQQSQAAPKQSQPSGGGDFTDDFGDVPFIARDKGLIA